MPKPAQRGGRYVIANNRYQHPTNLPAGLVQESAEWSVRLYLASCFTYDQEQYETSV